ncbi:DinB family protein [Salibacterium sp. K-3]
MIVLASIEEYNKDIAGKLQYFINIGKDVEEKTASWRPSENEWSVQEVLAHVEEFPLFFTDELIGMVKYGQKEWGRGLDHFGRLAAVDKANTRSLPEIVEGIRQTQHITAERLQSLKNEDLQKVVSHRNPKFGEKPMEFLVTHFLIEHLDTHQNQVQRVLRQYEQNHA